MKERIYNIKEEKDSAKRKMKKFQKNFKKGVDICKRKWYTNKAVAKSGGGNRSLKREQQERNALLL